jgi:hypothetical protein
MVVLEGTARLLVDEAAGESFMNMGVFVPLT